MEKLSPSTTNRNLKAVKTLPFLQAKQPLTDRDITNNVRIDSLLSVTDCNRVYHGKHLVSPNRHVAIFKIIFSWVIPGGISRKTMPSSTESPIDLQLTTCWKNSGSVKNLLNKRLCTTTSTPTDVFQTNVTPLPFQRKTIPWSKENQDPWL